MCGNSRRLSALEYGFALPPEPIHGMLTSGLDFPTVCRGVQRARLPRWRWLSLGLRLQSVKVGDSTKTPVDPSPINRLA